MRQDRIRLPSCGIMGVSDVSLPRKVRLRPRRHVAASGRTRVDRTGRTYDDFLALPGPDRLRVVQGDSVCGLSSNARDILSLHVVTRSFQVYLPKDHGGPQATVKWLDVIEVALGSPEAFEKAFGIMLVDRGTEFDDFEGMERSALVRESDVVACSIATPWTPTRSPKQSAIISSSEGFCPNAEAISTP